MSHLIIDLYLIDGYKALIKIALGLLEKVYEELREKNFLDNLKHFRDYI